MPRAKPSVTENSSSLVPPPTADAAGAARAFRLLRAVAVIIPLLMFAAATTYDYCQQIHEARTHVATTATALAEHAEQVLENARLVLALMTERVSGMDWPQIRGDAALHDYLVGLAHELPEVESVFLVDPAGQLAATSRAFPAPPLDARMRDYFRAAEAGQTGLFVSAPFRGRISDTVAFTVSRARDKGAADARSGVVGVMLSPAYFDRFYHGVADRPGNAVALLLRDDGTVLVRMPDRPDRPEKLHPGTPTMQPLDPGHATVIEGASDIDGIHRIGAVRGLPGLKLRVVYGEDPSIYLQDFYQHIAALACFALLMALVLYLAARAALAQARRETGGLQRLLAETRRREQAEAALRQAQKMEALGRLTGGVAHDFNNLLTAILGALELAMKRVRDPAVTRLLGGAVDASNKGARLTRQMLAFARQETVEMGAVAVNEVVRGIDDLLRRTLGSDIRVQHVLAADLWPAMADRTQLEVAILNLAINARDAMPKGGLLRVQTANLPPGAPRPADLPAGDMVVIAVTDTGGGMTGEVLARAFDPFFTTKDVGSGTGLGLSMVHGFATQAGGTVRAQSTPGQGTTIRLFLPRAAAAPVAPAAADDAAAARAAPRRVLLVDDDPAVRELTAAMLRELGHVVTPAADAAAAARVLAGPAPPDLMICDFAMPGTNGGEVARAALAEHPGLTVLFITGFDGAEQLRPWADRGFPILHKPFGLADLAAAIAGAATAPEPKSNVVRLRGG